MNFCSFLHFIFYCLPILRRREVSVCDFEETNIKHLTYVEKIKVLNLYNESRELHLNLWNLNMIFSKEPSKWPRFLLYLVSSIVYSWRSFQLCMISRSKSKIWRLGNFPNLRRWWRMESLFIQIMSIFKKSIYYSYTVYQNELQKKVKKIIMQFQFQITFSNRQNYIKQKIS